MKNATKKTLLASLVVPFALGAQSISAAEITEWGYDIDNVFDNISETGGDGTVAGAGTNTLNWGTGPSSSLTITNRSESSGLVTNDSNFEDGGVFTHDNQIIDGSDSSLTGFDLTSTLTLTPFAPPGSALPSESRTFDSTFSETMNIAGTCVDASTGTSCADIFTVTNIDAIGGVEQNDGSYLLASPSFTVDDYSYTVFTRLAGLTTLDDDACDEAAGAASGCVGLITEEESTNSYQASLRIESERIEVPEPGTLALLGLGLTGLALARRKAHQ